MKGSQLSETSLSWSVGSSMLDKFWSGSSGLWFLCTPGRGGASAPGTVAFRTALKFGGSSIASMHHVRSMAIFQPSWAILRLYKRIELRRRSRP